MTNRKKQIKEFLNKIYKYSLNSQNDISNDDVYEELVFNGIKKEKMCNQEEFFPYWQKYYQNSHNTSCFVDPTWKYFCQFVNDKKDSQKEYCEDPVKIYLSLDKDHIYEGAKIVFDYLSKENICHSSKIGKETRVDNIVLRIYNREDAIKVINFINSNKFLYKGHNQVSPFAFNVGITGLAIDNCNSFNMVVSTYVARYINQIKKIKKPSLEDFYNFVNEQTIDKEFMEQAADLNKYNKTDVIYMKEIKNLILKSLATDDLKVFFDHFDNVLGNAETKIPEKANKVSETNNDIYNALKTCIEATNEKYGKSQTIYALLMFLEEGNATGITRQSVSGMPVRSVICQIGNKPAKDYILSYTQTQDVNEAVNILYAEIIEKNIKRH